MLELATRILFVKEELTSALTDKELIKLDFKKHKDRVDHIFRVYGMTPNGKKGGW